MQKNKMQTKNRNKTAAKVRLLFLCSKIGGKRNDKERDQIQKKGKKGIIKDSHVTSGINNRLYPHCNHV